MTTATAPRVSVCIPARNHAPYIGAAITSALTQDAGALEVVVVDDGSQDRTGELVAAIRDPRVRLVRHATSQGVAVARNACLRAARGSYVAWLDADDERMPGTLARQLDLLDDEPGVVLVHGGHDVIDEQGRSLPDWPAPFEQHTIEPSPTAFGHLVAANEIATSTVVVRRSAHDDAGPFDERIGRSNTDWDMWLRLALRGAIAYLPQHAARYRQHANSISRETVAGGERLRSDVLVVERALDAGTGKRRAPDGVAADARAALAAKALLHAGDAYTRRRVPQALDAVRLAARLSPELVGSELLAAVDRRDDVVLRQLTRAALRRLATRLRDTRYGTRLARLVAPDAEWDASLARAGAAVARVTPSGAVLAVIAKWDPSLLARSGRAGCNYPDRELDPGGYPRDDEAAIAHLDALVAERGVTHLVVPAVCGWWLDHYAGLAAHLGAPVWRDGDCMVFELGARP